MGGGSKKQTIGYDYSVGMHMIFCHGPIDNVSRIYAGGTLIYDQESTGGTIEIDAPNAFGGRSREGGIVGSVDIEFGEANQGRNSYLESVLPGLVPAYRGVVGLVLKGVNLGMNPYIKPWSIRASRVRTRTDGREQWQPSLAAIPVEITNEDTANEVIETLNAAHIVRECFTNDVWGLGIPETRIDEASFASCANRFKNDGMGLSLIWDTQMAIKDFIALVVKHVDATVYADRKTGNIKMALIREPNEVQLETAYRLSPSNVVKITEAGRPVFGELTTSVTVKFHDVVKGKEASVTVSDPSLAEEQGKSKNATVTYEGFVDRETAAKVAARDLQVLSNPLFSCKIECFQDEIENLENGDILFLTWPDYGIDNLRLRVTRLLYGDHSSNLAVIECVEDLFSLPENSVVSSAPSKWVTPIAEIGPILASVAQEATYYDLVRNSGQDAVDFALETNPFSSYLITSAGKPSGFTINAKMLTDAGAGFEEVGQVEFVPFGQLTENLLRSDNVFVLENTKDFDDIEIGEFVQINNELMAVIAIDGFEVTVKRGILDTVPVNHASGSYAVFWDDAGTLDETEYVASDIVTVKLIGFSGGSSFPVGDAAANVISVTGRAFKPFPPGALSFNGDFFPTGEISGLVQVEWVDRNRKLATGGAYVGFEDPNVTIEPGTTYGIQLFDDTGTLVLDDPNVTSPYVLNLNDYQGNTATIRFELFSVRDGVESFQRHKVLLELPTSAATGNVFFEMSGPANPPAGNDVNFEMSE